MLEIMVKVAVAQKVKGQRRFSMQARCCGTLILGFGKKRNNINVFLKKVKSRFSPYCMSRRKVKSLACLNEGGDDVTVQNC